MELKAKGAEPLTFHEFGPAGAQAFHDSITAAKQNKFGAAVHVYEPDEYKGMRLFMTVDGKDGFALKGDDIVSLFKHPEQKTMGVATTSLALATQQGGRKLDCFDTMLPELYSKSGFHAVARLPFSDEFAPPGWNHETFSKFNGGRPDVVFMAYNAADPARYKAGEGERIDDYDQGAVKQADYLAAVNPATEVDDPDRPMTAEEEAASRTERARPENVSEYELPRVSYSRSFKEQDERNPGMFKSEAEYKAIGGALNDYKKATSDGDAYAVNRTLRGTEATTPRLQQAVDNIDLGFQRTAAPIKSYDTKQPKDGWLYRGISNRTQLDLKEGDEFRDDGFGSTTIHKSFAQAWARDKGPGGTLVKITVPAGTKVMPLMDSSGQDEGEVLLNRGTRFRVTNVTGKNIEMTVLP